MKKCIKRITGALLALSMVFTGNTMTYALSTSVEAGDDVVITEDDKPFLSLGADLSAEQQHTVLELMGIKAEDLDDYDVVYVNNEEEHEYLGDYISAAEIGTHSLSSVVITQADPGTGIKLSVYNVDYCTVGMYKNACATAGVTDANIIVAAPFTISGTAALVGILKAYEEMTGEDIDEEVVDAAMDELVTTGELNESIGGDSKEVEAFIADLKTQLETADWQDDEDILTAIDDTSRKYDITLKPEDKEKILALMKKLKDVDIDWGAVADQASDWADKIKDIDVDTEGILEKIASFFEKIAEFIRSLF